MTGHRNPLVIQTSFNGSHPNHNLYIRAIDQTLRKILPKTIKSPILNDPDLLEDQGREFFENLPLFKSSLREKTPSTLTFSIISKARPNACKFFFDMIGNWLIPGKQLEIQFCSSIDFSLPQYSLETVLTFCEMMVRINSKVDLQELQYNLPIIETEIRLGMQSSHYARRILEIKGLSTDSKTSLIHEWITSFMNRFPKAFDHDLLTEMQHILVICRDEFKANRQCRHLCRIITAHYLFRKLLFTALKGQPHKRHLILKLFKCTLYSPEETRSAVGILVGVNFLRDKEVLEERHLLSAIQNYIPSARAVENSFFSNRRGHETIATLYLEIQKGNGERFTKEELRILRKELPSDLRDRIEHLMHPVFMPRNEEEIMRNILTLSHQIKYIQDLPQVIISFDRQTDHDLFFLVMMVRVVKPGSLSLQDLMKKAKPTFGYIHDRSKTLGYLRKQYAKEATVFGIKLPKDLFLRLDHSIDLNKARQAAMTELSRVLGEIRDFNGGMITKQNELLCALREELGHSVKYNDLLLENFFYSLTPDIMRTVLDVNLLKNLFTLLIESLDEGLFSNKNNFLKIRRTPHHVFAIIKTEERSLKDKLCHVLYPLDPTSSKLACSFVVVYEVGYIGFLFLCEDPDQQQSFCRAIQTFLSKFKRPAHTHSASFAITSSGQ